MKLKGKTALVTGAASGLGRAIALAFAREGARVGVNDLNEEAAGATVSEIARHGGQAQAFVADVSSSEAVRRMFAAFLDTFDGIDILVNNAGIKAGYRYNQGRTTADLTDDEWRRMMGVHLDGTFYCTREALHAMLKQRSGRIINIGSISGMQGFIGLDGTADYCAAKGGIIAFTKAVAVEVARHGVLVNCIAPGYILLPTMTVAPEVRSHITASIPLGRFGEAADVAQTAVFLACDDSAYFVGQVLSPNGGYVT